MGRRHLISFRIFSEVLFAFTYFSTPYCDLFSASFIIELEIISST